MNGMRNSMRKMGLVAVVILALALAGAVGCDGSFSVSPESGGSESANSDDGNASSVPTRSKGDATPSGSSGTGPAIDDTATPVYGSGPVGPANPGKGLDPPSGAPGPDEGAAVDVAPTPASNDASPPPKSDGGNNTADPVPAGDNGSEDVADPPPGNDDMTREEEDLVQSEQENQRHDTAIDIIGNMGAGCTKYVDPGCY